MRAPAKPLRRMTGGGGEGVVAVVAVVGSRRRVNRRRGNMGGRVLGDGRGRVRRSH